MSLNIGKVATGNWINCVVIGSHSDRPEAGFADWGNIGDLFGVNQGYEIELVS